MTDRQETAQAVGEPEVREYICEQIASGRSLRSICDEDDVPSKTTVFRWLESDLEFRDQYARAREAQADTLFDEILDISDDSTNDYMLNVGLYILFVFFVRCSDCIDFKHVV